MRSRGIETSETVWPTGSSEATIIVSVSVCVRCRVVSTPTSRTLIRSPSFGTGPFAGAWSSVAPRTGPVKIRSNVSPRIVP